ncbi:MAG: DUF2808 domain-containing protein [Cyanobacteria bacterium KgW148]|nr:DUF2808 domain-containing protein [Cyanobacteria bacterium KgW148]
MFKPALFLSFLVLGSNVLPLFAQSGAGFILYGDVRDKALNYSLDDGSARLTDRYFLDLKPQKFKIGEIVINIPETFDGRFDPDRMEVRIKDKALPLRSKKLDMEGRRIELVLAEPVPPNVSLTVVLAGVTNPNFPGIYKFDANLISADSAPILRYIGSWIIDFN